jgi:hypothetical protein
MILEVKAAGATPQERPSALTGEQQHNPRKEVRKGCRRNWQEYWLR